MKTSMYLVEKEVSFLEPCFLISDNSLEYNSKDQEKEKRRAFYLVKLVEKYGYTPESIRLDLMLKNTETVDLVVFENNLPYILIDFSCSLKEKRIPSNLLEKARELKVSYLAIISSDSEYFFRLWPKIERINDLPLEKIECPLCKLIEKSMKENQEISEQEIRETLKKSRNRGIIIMKQDFKDKKQKNEENFQN